MMKRSGRKVLLGGVIVSALLNATGQMYFKAARATQSDAALFSLFSII